MLMPKPVMMLVLALLLSLVLVLPAMSFEGCSAPLGQKRCAGEYQQWPGQGDRSGRKLHQS